jgi:hypothetical protein
MPTLGTTEIMRAMIESGSRSANSSITRRLERLEINDADKPEMMLQEFQRLRRMIQSDLGGEERLSMTEIKQVDAFASNSVVYDFVNGKFLAEANVQNCRNLAGIGVSLTTAMVRAAHKLGTKRQSEVVPTMDELLELRGHLPVDPAGDDVE